MTLLVPHSKIFLLEAESTESLQKHLQVMLRRPRYQALWHVRDQP